MLMCVMYVSLYCFIHSSWAEWGSQFLLERAFCSIMSWFSGSSWFLLVPPGSSWFLLVPPCSSLFLLVLARVPVLVGSVPSWFPRSSWFRIGFRCLFPFFSLLFSREIGFVPSWLCGSSWFRLGFRCLSPFYFLLSPYGKGVLFPHDVLVPPGSGACVPSSSFFSFSQEMRFCSATIAWFRLYVLYASCLPSSIEHLNFDMNGSR